MSDKGEPTGGFTPKERQALFVEMAKNKDGVTAQEVHEVALQRGDKATIEAYHNLGRRLSHRGLLTADKKDRHTRYFAGSEVDGQWLDEEQLASIVDSEYPLIALTVMKESIRQLRDIPESIWIEARMRLMSEPARPLVLTALKEYADNLCDELEHYSTESKRPEAINDLPKIRREIESALSLLKQVAKHGLGISREAIYVPPNFELALRFREENPGKCLYDDELLAEEVSQRVADEPVVVEVPSKTIDQDLLIAAVDGSSRGGLLAFDGEDGDFSVGHAPMVSINTAVAQINRTVKIGTTSHPAFMRLPEKPEDMQTLDNRYTIMAKLFFPDLTDAQYAHSVWNAMDALEAKAALKVMGRWYTPKTGLEIRPADVILRDGSIIPQDRDSVHYKQQDSYGKIVRDLIEKNWEIARKSRDDGQSVVGVVKNAQVRVFSPIINLFLRNLSARGGKTQMAMWPIRAMNHLPDQVILTRILTSGRKVGDQWWRTCITIKPFHAATDLAGSYSRKHGNLPADVFAKKADLVKSGKATDMSEEEKFFWQNFRGERDHYVQMLSHVWYGSFYLGAVPRLDIEKLLPRFEFILTHPTAESGKFPDAATAPHVDRTLAAIRSTGFEVSSEHSMFQSEAKIDVLPALLIRAHDTVKIWATELLSRVQEYIGFHLSRFAKTSRLTGVRVRQWRKAELETLAKQLQKERDRLAGASQAAEDQPRLTGEHDGQGQD